MHYDYSFAYVEQRVIAGKLVRLTQKLAIQQHLITETFTACTCILCPSSELKKLLDIPSYTYQFVLDE
jgi:hypothetical protein